MTLLRRQDGMALIVSLLLLLILTVLAISMASTSTLQQRISGNAQQQNIAFQASESGLRYWVDWFTKHDSKPPEGTVIPIEPTSGSSGSARARLTSTSIECAKMIPAQSLSVSGYTYYCYQVSSQAKACKDLDNCDVAISDGQARALHRRSFIQATHN